MKYQEQALSFPCQGEQLFGIVTLPQQAGHRGMLIVVGGPQYRAGSHRQFTLVARGVAQQGVATMRFDYRGMGDSEGDIRSFEAVQDDLRSALDQFFLAVPAMREVVIWGLCDGATAALMYASQDARVSGLVLLNPWARTENGVAKARLKHYYLSRLLDAGLWKKIASGRFDVAATGKSFLMQLRNAFGGAAVAAGAARGAAPAIAPLPERMQASLRVFGGKVLLIIAEADLTGQEFMGIAKGSKHWRSLMAASRVTSKKLPGADHTFSRRVWREQVIAWTADWLRSW